MKMISRMFGGAKRAAAEEAARVAAQAAAEAEKAEAKRAMSALNEMRGTEKWKKTVRFEAGSINIVLISFAAPFGYRGEKARVDVRADGLMRARVTDEFGNNRDFTVPSERHPEMLKAFQKSLAGDRPPSVQGLPQSAAHLVHARHAAVGEFIQSRLTAVLGKDASPDL